VINIERHWQDEWFAVSNDGTLYHLGNCGDQECAEEIATDVLPPDSWLLVADGIKANQWVETISKAFAQSTTAR